MRRVSPKFTISSLKLLPVFNIVVQSGIGPCRCLQPGSNVANQQHECRQRKNISQSDYKKTNILQGLHVKKIIMHQSSLVVDDINLTFIEERSSEYKITAREVWYQGEDL